NLAALQSVEELLEGELRRGSDTRVHSARSIEGGRRQENGGRHRDGEREVKRDECAGRSDAERGDSRALPHEAAPVGGEVSVDTDQRSRPVDGDGGRGHFVR